jgi:hypothetical protein
MAGRVDKLDQMTSNVTVVIKAQILPFGVWREDRVVHLVSPPVGQAAVEPMFPEPTTLVNHIITSAPARLVRA